MHTNTLFYNHKVRTRVCGLLFSNNQLLLVKHKINGRTFYAPPGGRVEFGETLEQALKREILEETCITISSQKFKFVTEYINMPLHAIEIFYLIDSWQGIPSKGYDPESVDNEVIQEVKWFPIHEIKRIKKEELHHVLHSFNNLKDILELSGYIPYPTI